MHFEFAGFLYLLLLLPLFLGLRRLISGGLSLKYFFLLAGSSFLVLALAGYFRESSYPVKNFLVLIDVTRSMTIRDMPGANGEKISRLDFAKKEIADIIAVLPKGTRVGIGVTVTSQWEYTQDSNIKIFWPVETVTEENAGDIYRALEIVSWWNAWGDRSEWPPFLSSVEWLLEQKRLPENLNIIVITDGGSDIAGDKILTLKKSFLNKKIRFIFLGVGGDKVLPVPEFDEKLRETGKCFVNLSDKSGECFKSRLEEKNLQRLAEILEKKASYVRFTGRDDLVRAIADERNLTAGRENMKIDGSNRFLLSALIFLILFFV